jgi:hypothetical protein
MSRKKRASGSNGGENEKKVRYGGVYMYVIMMVENIILSETYRSTLDYLLISRFDAGLPNYLIKTRQRLHVLYNNFNDVRYIWFMKVEERSCKR